MTWQVFLVTVCALAGAVADENIGSFWQITDVHYDANYSALGETKDHCHLWPQDDSLGEFGDYQCDIPWALVASAINAMKLLYPNPDFILWTGDTVPYIPDDEYSTAKVYTLNKNVTDKLMEVFPGVPLYPALGNHDVWPSNQQPPDNIAYYQGFLSESGWDQLLDQDNQHTFRDGGYYSTKLGSGLRLIQLNSILWYSQNKLVSDTGDPAKQFQWLSQQLGLARQSKEKVLLMTHIAPGQPGSHANHFILLYPGFNHRLYTIIKDYADVLVATIHGHEHQDAFRIIYDESGSPAVPVFVAPAVTPRGDHNPSIRRYSYDSHSGQVLDYYQYYLNLTKANADGNADWRLEYQLTKDYSVADGGAGSLNSLVEDFRAASSEQFHKYRVFHSVSYNTSSKCNVSCKQRHLCAITKVDFDEFSECLASMQQTKHTQTGEDLHILPSMMDHYFNSTHRKEHHHRHRVPQFMYVVIGGLVVLAVFIFFILAIFCCHRRHVVAYFSQPRYTPIST